MRKKTVEVPQVQFIAKFADVQFKEMNPWRYRGRFQDRRLSRRLWRYLGSCGRTSDQGAASFPRSRRTVSCSSTTWKSSTTVEIPQRQVIDGDI